MADVVGIVLIRLKGLEKLVTEGVTGCLFFA